ncbi:response regulator [Magnetococcales bacterium HHB-1]
MKLLFVDDSKTVCAVYKNLLQKHGYHVLIAHNMAEALKVVHEAHPPLAVVDYFMPGGNGDELTRAILSDPKTKDILVVMHSQRSDLVKEALTAGAIDLIFKEDPEEIFLMRLHALRRFIATQEEAKARLKQVESLKSENRAMELTNQAKSRFVASMSHELRTPLNGMLGMVELLARTPLEEKQQSYIHHLQRSGNTLLHLINDILDFAKIEAEKITLEKIAFRLDDLLKDINIQYNILIKSDALNYQTEILDTLPIVVGDPFRLRQVLANLLNNALKFTKKGYIALRCQIEEEDHQINALFEIEDSGIGMTPAQQQMVFSPFTQAEEATTRKFGGTGLGLTIVHGLIELMGGEISIESQPDQGTCFKVSIPFKPYQGKEEIFEKRRHDHQDQALFKKTQGVILIAEDDLVSGLYIQEMLTHLGLSFKRAFNGQEAVELWQKEPFALILMDYQMPILDGLEATQKIRTLEKDHPEREPTPIIALTAFASLEDREKGFKVGMNDFLSKPLEPHKLHPILSNWLPQMTPESKPDPTTEIESHTAFDFTSLKNTLGDSGFKAVAKAFIEMLPQLIESLDLAIKADNPDTIARMAHQLKGRAGAMKASQLEAVCAELVALGRQEETEGSVLLFKKIKELSKQVVSSLEKELN